LKQVIINSRVNNNIKTGVIMSGISIPNVSDWIDKNIKTGLWHKSIDMTSSSDGSSFKEMNWFFKMNDCFSVAELQDSLFSSAYSHSGGQKAGISDKWDSITSPVQLCNNALSKFGSISGVGTTVKDLKALNSFLLQVSQGGNSDIAQALNAEYPGAQGEGMRNQLAALSATLTPLIADGTDGVNMYTKDLKAIKNPTESDGTSANAPKDVTTEMNNIKSISGVISGVQNLFEGASQAASASMKSLQAAQNAIMALLSKLMQGDHSTFKTMIQNMNKQ
jgi:hypothetical protein